MTTKSPQLALSLTLLLIALLASGTGCGGEQLSAVPPQLVGEWRTADARYQGRSMNLASDRVTFGMGHIAPDRLEHVDSVRTISVENGQEYRITLRTPEATQDTLVLDFSQENGGELHLKSQPRIVWTRVKATSSAPVPVPQSPELPPTPATSVMKEHKVIYKIDCVHSKNCKSY